VRAIGYFWKGPEDGRVISLTKQDLERGKVEIRDANGTSTHYTVVVLEREQPVDDLLATHKLVPEEA
jgi:hypothetical protein